MKEAAELKEFDSIRPVFNVRVDKLMVWNSNPSLGGQAFVYFEKDHSGARAFR